MNARHNRLILGCLLSLFLCPGAMAYSVTLAEGNPVRWNKATVSYQLHSACSPDVPTTQCLNALRNSFAQWTGHACADLTFQEQSLTTNTKVTAIGYGSNGANELVFIENNQWTFGTYTLGVTAPIFYQDGTIIEADIAFNGLQQTWTATGQNGLMDIMNVAVHEIGHFFGLSHNLGPYAPSNPPTMATTADPYLKSQTPEQDDINGLCFLQPQGAHSCSSTDDCPMIIEDGPNGEYYAGQLTCESGLCGGMTNVIPAGDGQLGDPCVGSYDCEEPLFCQSVNSGASVCASECNPSAPNCPAGYDCVGFQNSPGKGVCLPEQGGPSNGSKEVGDACNSSFECKSQLCISEAGGGGGVCRQPCTTDTDCPQGSVCYPLQGANGGACFDDGGSSSGGQKEAGESCSSASDCKSGLCVGGSGSGYLCVDACNSNADCPVGTACLPLQGGGGACFDVDLKEMGEECASNDECPSGTCLSLGGPYFCTDTCVAHTDCPCGMECTQTNGGNYCNIGGPSIGCVPEGAACTEDVECSSAICRFGTCQIACSIFMGDALCPEGESCGRMTLDAPDGFCMKAGIKGTGEYCAADLACYSLFCHEGACETPCNPFGPNTCGAGLVCEAALEAVGVCSEPPPVGQADAGSSDIHAPDAQGPLPGTPTQPTLPAPGDDTGGCRSAGPAQGPWLLFLLSGAFLVFWKRRDPIDLT